MENFVSRSKYVVETISITADFSGIIPAGQTITGTPQVSVSVFTGTDPTPTDILYLGVTIHKGTRVEQRFRLGIPGTIYEITWQVVSTGGEEFEKTSYLAILPNIGDANPEHITKYQTSCLYPYELSDSLTSSVEFVGGFTGYVGPPEWLASSVVFQYGVLVGGFVPYSYEEGLTSSIEWTLGTVGGEYVIYDNPPEGLQSDVAWVSGELIGTFISYLNPPEWLQSSVVWVSGSIS